jgi:Signal peptidase (SPase) II
MRTPFIIVGGVGLHCPAVLVAADPPFVGRRKVNEEVRPRSGVHVCDGGGSPAPDRGLARHVATTCFLRATSRPMRCRRMGSIWQNREHATDAAMGSAGGCGPVDNRLRPRDEARRYGTSRWRARSLVSRRHRPAGVRREHRGILEPGGRLAEAARIAVFTVATGFALLALVVLAIRDRFAGPSTVGLVLFVAGGSSNWIDRVLHGRVVDFLNLGIGPIRRVSSTWQMSQSWPGRHFVALRRATR